jgi:hypothetical protein
VSCVIGTTQARAKSRSSLRPALSRRGPVFCWRYASEQHHWGIPGRSEWVSESLTAIGISGSPSALALGNSSSNSPRRLARAGASCRSDRSERLRGRVARRSSPRTWNGASGGEADIVVAARHSSGHVHRIAQGLFRSLCWRRSSVRSLAIATGGAGRSWFSTTASVRSSRASVPSWCPRGVRRHAESVPACHADVLERIGAQSLSVLLAERSQIRSTAGILAVSP